MNIYMYYKRFIMVNSKAQTLHLHTFYISQKCLLSLSPPSLPLFLPPTPPSSSPSPSPRPLSPLFCRKCQSIVENFMFWWATFPGKFKILPSRIHFDTKWAKGGYANLTGTSRGSITETLTWKIKHRSLKGRFWTEKESGTVVQREHHL